MFMKIIKMLAVFAATVCCGLALASCGKNTQKTYNGDYHYDTDYGTYGIKVSVSVDNGVITKVTIEDSDYIEVSESWSGNTVWKDGVEALLKKYEGKTVEETLAIEVSCEESGQPVNGQEFDGLVVTGSTQSSGRLLLAVQDALKNS